MESSSTRRPEKASPEEEEEEEPSIARKSHMAKKRPRSALEEEDDDDDDDDDDDSEEEDDEHFLFKSSSNKRTTNNRSHYHHAETMVAVAGTLNNDANSNNRAEDSSENNNSYSNKIRKNDDHDDHVGDSSSILRHILGPHAQLLSFTQFIETYLPPLLSSTILAELEQYNNNNNNNGAKTTTTPDASASASVVELLRRTVFYCPSSFFADHDGSFPAASASLLAKIKVIRHDEPLASLVDHVVWSLVQRRERCKRILVRSNSSHHPQQHQRTTASSTNGNAPYAYNPNNLLSQCHVIPSDYHFHRSRSAATTTAATNNSSSMPAGVVMTRVNNNVDYCKTSPLMKLLHRLVGDDVLRVILMHTSIFIPIVSPSASSSSSLSASAFPSAAEPAAAATVSSAASRDENKNDSFHRGNYMQLTGPPLQPCNSRSRGKSGKPTTTKTTTTSVTTSMPKKTRHKKRKRPPSSTRRSGENSNKEKDMNDIMDRNPRPQPQQAAAAAQHWMMMKMKPISRQSLFYSNAYVPKVGLPLHHILNDPTCVAPALLVDLLNLPKTTTATRKPDVDNNNNNNKDNQSDRKQQQQQQQQQQGRFHCSSKSKTWKRVRTAGIPLCQAILDRHKRCDYARILEHYCPLPEFCRKSSSGSNNNSSRDNKTKRTTTKQQQSTSTSTTTTTLPPPRQNEQSPPQQQQEPSSLSSSSTPVVSLAQVSAAHTPVNQVVSCLSSILKRVFPLDVWGNNENFSTVLGHVETFCKLRRNEQINGSTLIQGIRVTKIPWLWRQHGTYSATSGGGQDDDDDDDTASAQEQEQNGKKNTNKKKGKKLNISRSDHQAAERLLVQSLRWIFSNFIIPFLRSTFYVTESEFSGKRVLYYRKPVWSMLRNLSMKSLLHRDEEDGGGETNEKLKQYRELSPREAAERFSRQEMGFSRLRLLPKATGVRPIAMLGKAEVVQPYCSTEMTMNKSTGTVTGLELDEMDCNDMFLFKGNDEREAGPSRKRQRLKGPGGTAAATPPPPLGSASRRRLRWPLSTNAVLNDAFSVLRHKYSNDKEAFGSGVYGLAYFYPRYRKFIEQLKPQLSANTRIYFGSVDIHHCYDNIQHDHLLKIVEDVLTEDDYLIQCYWILRRDEQQSTCDGGDVKIIKRQQKLIGPPEQFDPFHIVAQELAQNARRTVFVDCMGCATANKDRLMKQLREHLTSNLIVTKGRFRERFLLQSTGIPQGSIMSSLLCNYYYGDVERRLFPNTALTKYGINKKNPDEGDATSSDAASHYQDKEDCSLLARMVDDFMLVSTDHGRLRAFLQTMSRGESSLGVCINKHKTQVSVDTVIEVDGDDASTKTTETISSQGNSTSFPWCGMLFDTRTGEVRVDYSRFHDGKAYDGLTVDRCVYRRHDQNEASSFLTSSLKGFVRPRCIPILFDPFINSVLVQKINFYQLQVLAAVKMAGYLRTTAMMTRRSCDSSNVVYLLSCIENGAIQYAIDMIRHHLSSSSSGPGFMLQPNHSDRSKNTIRWLGWKAFADVFGRQRAEFPHLSEAIGEKSSTIRTNEATQTIASRALREIQLGKLL